MPTMNDLTGGLPSLLGTAPNAQRPAGLAPGLTGGASGDAAMAEQYRQALLNAMAGFQMNNTVGMAQDQMADARARRPKDMRALGPMHPVGAALYGLGDMLNAYTSKKREDEARAKIEAAQQQYGQKTDDLLGAIMREKYGLNLDGSPVDNGAAPTFQPEIFSMLE